ncbi:hypothetical protein L873DRAFT_361775 [Choiromyces venosus 120613-1]|uniref:Uncharacterized protein n=1 Tax=Choiromyces venosus 120613-1 TaxID=1336337 RepID=A0A3N4K0G7_9PEZI|nr:hypothetical protein L873DRAFT_361775 [Choiromyces venosus 120613-1]
MYPLSVVGHPSRRTDIVMGLGCFGWLRHGFLLRWRVCKEAFDLSSILWQVAMRWISFFGLTVGERHAARCMPIRRFSSTSVFIIYGIENTNTVIKNAKSDFSLHSSVVVLSENGHHIEKEVAALSHTLDIVVSWQCEGENSLRIIGADVNGLE